MAGVSRILSGRPAPNFVMYYPLFLDLEGQSVVVIGAGSVATRKTRTLLGAGADVTVISPKASAVIQRLSRAKRVRWICRTYRRGDLIHARLVIAATDDLTVNQCVCAEAKRRRLLANCAAPPSAGNFMVPSQIRHSGISVAISTGGASPSFAKRLRRDLERFLSRGYPQLLKRMRAARQRGRVSRSKKSP